MARLALMWTGTSFVAATQQAFTINWQMRFGMPVLLCSTYTLLWRAGIQRRAGGLMLLEGQNRLETMKSYLWELCKEVEWLTINWQMRFGMPVLLCSTYTLLWRAGIQRRAGGLMLLEGQNRLETMKSYLWELCKEVEWLTINWQMRFGMPVLLQLCSTTYIRTSSLEGGNSVHRAACHPMPAG